MHRIATLLLLTALALNLTACAAPLTREQAQEKALAAFTADGAHEGPLEEVMVLKVVETATAAGQGWEFELSGKVVLPGLPEGYLVTAVLFVDAAKGTVTTVAEG